MCEVQISKVIPEGRAHGILQQFKTPFILKATFLPLCLEMRNYNSKIGFFFQTHLGVNDSKYIFVLLKGGATRSNCQMKRTNLISVEKNLFEKTQQKFQFGCNLA